MGSELTQVKYQILASPVSNSVTHPTKTLDWAFSSRYLITLNSPLGLIDFYHLHMQAILISLSGLIASLLIFSD